MFIPFEYYYLRDTTHDNEENCRESGRGLEPEKQIEAEVCTAKAYVAGYDRSVEP